mmetsp:Transcript_31506/g.28699  ORF Transcript_31506/g.28699 Transcript_31506/m.28699 type:complete len:106 (+) Transcript_31506:121-438(+)|eukprot:CAMPEP_0114581774 /NCGR_PEP_ID=MMETSP0125-20121206/5848_1 /TAXON_ID=485358 ORGANISM="Aristerostoma sp., Strain ATCC 50986" /NCGR_SAMPLE_ID=MMETSP0125 /ASSEMBLY_ACC=CAM_ASM_000245 /LENGTH=105 /DNA_ID=CAMNT_0001774249 /DNA_START=193 /DNA_END=510 /DNA_ORIENTATION=+
MNKSPSTGMSGVDLQRDTSTTPRKVQSRIKAGRPEKDKTEIFSHTKIPEEENDFTFHTGFRELDMFINDLKQKDFDDKIGICQEVEGFFKDMMISYSLRIKQMKE